MVKHQKLQFYKKLAIVFAISNIVLGVWLGVFYLNSSSWIEHYKKLYNWSESNCTKFIEDYENLLDSSRSNFSYYYHSLESNCTYYLNACYEREEEYGNMIDLLLGKSHVNSTTAKANNQTNYSYFGGRIIAADGQFLGVINSNSYDPDSIANSYGTYGNEYSAKSIWNKYGTYGNLYSTYSVYNSYANSPPSVYLNGVFYAYLTKNTFKSPRLDPDVVAIVIRTNT